MKKTRNLFVLSGNSKGVDAVIETLSCQYKALIAVNLCTEKEVYDIFDINKSIICAEENLQNFSSTLKKLAIPIKIVDSWNASDISSDSDFIISDSNDILTQFQKIVDKYICDIGDHKSNSSGLTGIPTANDCVYCHYLHSENDLHYDTSINRTVYSNNNFFVMPTVGQFMLGYLLIIPKSHILSIASSSLSLKKDFLEVLEDVQHILTLTYNNPNHLIWENGTGSGGIGKAKDSIVHAHVHIVPTELVNTDIIKTKYGIPLTNVSFGEISSYTKNSYLLMRNPNNGWEICSNPTFYIPRQFVRQVLAEFHKIPDEQWNWRYYPFSEMLYQTTNDIKQALRNNWSSLPKRIQDNTRNYL